MAAELSAPSGEAVDEQQRHRSLESFADFVPYIPIMLAFFERSLATYSTIPVILFMVLRTRKVPLFDSFSVIAFLAVAWVWFTTTWASVPDLSRNHAITITLVLLYVSMLRLEFQTSSNWWRAIRVIAYGGTAHAVAYLTTSTAKQLTTDAGDAGLPRLFSSFANPNYGGLVMATAMAALILLLNRPSLDRSFTGTVSGRWIWAALVFNGTVLLLTQSRSSLAGLSIFVLVVLLRRFSPLTHLLVSGTTIVVAYFSYQHSLATFLNWAGVSDVTQSVGFARSDWALQSLSDRVYIWETYGQLIDEKPTTGYGVGSYWLDSLTGMQAHNAVLDLQAAGGLVLVVLYGALIALAYYGHPSREHHGDSLMLAAGFLGLLLPTWAVNIQEWSLILWVVVALMATKRAATDGLAGDADFLTAGLDRRRERGRSQNAPSPPPRPTAQALVGVERKPVKNPWTGNLTTLQATEGNDPV